MYPRAPADADRVLAKAALDLDRRPAPMRGFQALARLLSYQTRLQELQARHMLGLALLQALVLASPSQRR